jgi:hypothetical protein
MPKQTSPPPLPVAKKPQKALPTTPIVTDKEKKMKTEIAKLTEQVVRFFFEVIVLGCRLSTVA